jgi:hypothetical protein
MLQNPNALITSKMQTKIFDDAHFLQENVLLYFGFSMVCTGATTNTVQLVDQSNQVRATLSQQNAPADFLWTNGPALFNWTSGGLPFHWSNFPVWSAFQWPLNAITRGVGFNITTLGASNVFQKMARQLKKTPATWGANQNLTR